MSERAATAAVKVLERFGVQYAFSVPGESFLGLLDAFYDSSIQLISARHEGGAAFMAEAVGKLTGVPAVCMGTRGVGSSNLAIGIHTAYQDSTPMIVMPGQVETPFRHRDGFQEVDLGPFLGHITKWSIEVPSGARLPDLTAEAARRSVAGRPGPVSLALRGDILEECAEAELPEPTALPAAAPRAADVTGTLRMLAGARRPLIVAGAGVLRSSSTADLVRFAEHTGIPVMTAFRRHDAFPNTHPLYVGSLSIGAPADVIERARSADVLLALGTRLSETTTFGYTVPSRGTRLVQVDVSPDVLGRSYPAEIAIAADAGETIRALQADAETIDWPDRTSDNDRDRAVFETATAPPAGSRVSNLVDPALVYAELGRKLPPEAILTSDAGNFYGWMSRYYRFAQPGTFLGPISGAMGYGVPAAVGASLVRNGQVPVVALAGDGGFLMTGSELAVAAQLDLPVKCILFNNSMYGTIRAHQERHYPGRVSGTDLWSPDFVTYVEAFGGRGVRVDDNRDIEAGLQEVLQHPGIALLEVMVSPDSMSVGQFD